MGFNTVHACDIHVTWPTWIRHACQHYCTMHVTSTLMLHACDIHITITVACMSYKHSWCRHVAWVWQSCMHVKCVWHACYMHNISSRDVCLYNSIYNTCFHRNNKHHGIIIKSVTVTLVAPINYPQCKTCANITNHWVTHNIQRKNLPLTYLVKGDNINALLFKALPYFVQHYAISIKHPHSNAIAH